LDLNTFLKHLLWSVSLMLILLVIFHYVLEGINYDSFLLAVILIVAVLAFLSILFVWRTIRKAIP